jgi:hypothetical protein
MWRSTPTLPRFSTDNSEVTRSPSPSSVSVSRFHETREHTLQLSSFSINNIDISVMGDYALWGTTRCAPQASQACLDLGGLHLDLGGLDLKSLGRHASARKSWTGVTPCVLGVVGNRFFADTPTLAFFSFHNITVTSIGDDAWLALISVA